MIQASCSEGLKPQSRKGPLEFITHFFRKRGKDDSTAKTDANEESSAESESESVVSHPHTSEEEIYLTTSTSQEDHSYIPGEYEHSDDETDEEDENCQRRTSITVTFRTTLQRVRDLDKDLEALRLSRHDNPVVQRKLLASYVSIPEASESSSTWSSPSHCSEQMHSESTLDAAGRETRLKSSDVYIDEPFGDIQEYLVRSPPPCLNTLNVFNFDSASLPAPSTANISYVSQEAVQSAPLPHVRQSCPMFKPLCTVQRKDQKKQQIDLWPLLCRSSDNVTELRSPAKNCTLNRERRESERMKERIRDRPTGSAPSSPLAATVVTRKKIRATKRPFTYPLQKTL